ncbi:MULTISPECIES: SOS response-associated peptidase family protein [unclassified Pseudarthrobacter]|uniref:SOS response-associated peptidase family protein n=1 Tax=unclassified Pseudarthrobacter TaxID=2647000 RepID=UPI003077EF82
MPIVAERLDEGTIDRHLLIARWGLVPSWAKDVKIGSRLINALSESILEKPSFRKVAVKRRASNPDGSYRHIEAEGGTYEEASENLYAILEEGQNLIAILKD